MAIGNVVVNVVDVGQGQCSFVEIYDDDGMNPQLLHTLLFDCGSDKRSTTDWEINLDYIVETVGKKDPSFDLVVLSHSDSDHVNLLLRLLEKFEKAGVTPTIGKVCYGGDWNNYTKSAKNVLSILVDKGWCAKPDIFTLPPDFSGFEDGSFIDTAVLWSSPDDVVAVTAMIGCVIKNFSTMEKSRSAAEGLNRVSLICALMYQTGASGEHSIKYIFCGDATNLTMAAFNSGIGASFPSTNNVMLTLPHHGSRVTGLDLGVASDEANEVAMEIVRNFSYYILPKTLSVSVYAKHNHPSFEIIRLFGKVVISWPILEDERFDMEKQHSLAAMMDVEVSFKDSDEKIPVGVYKTFNTPSCVFSTWYAYDGRSTFSYSLGIFSPLTATAASTIKSALNPHASWVYTTDNMGKTTLAGKVNLKEAASFTKLLRVIEPGLLMGAELTSGTWEEGFNRNEPAKKEGAFAPFAGMSRSPAIPRRIILTAVQSFL